MDNIYRFSPIKSKDELYQAINYVAKKTTELCKKITGSECHISYLTIFSHYPEEFEALKEILGALGEVVGDNNGPSFRLKEPIALPNNSLTKLRIRKPDPYRLQVGCNDFKMPDYASFKKEYLEKNPNNLRLIKRPEYEMIEFFDPDYDVLAYVVSKGII